MRRLQINPQKYDVELSVEYGSLQRETKDEYGQATVEFRFGETSGSVTLLSSEARRIGHWFLALEREMKRKVKSEKGGAP